MKAIRKRPGEAPEIIEVDNTLAALQAEVGGYIETVTIASDAVIICNEEGRILGLPDNCRVCGVDFVGTVLIVGTKGDDFFPGGGTHNVNRPRFNLCDKGGKLKAGSKAESLLTDKLKELRKELTEHD